MKRLVIISLFIVLFIAFIAVWNRSYQTGLEEAYIPIETSDSDMLIPSESGVFRRSEHALDYSNLPIDDAHSRTLGNYYKNRAYPGAPPSIPHPVTKEIDLGGNACLKCHENGGYTEKYGAYAPVTPHPEMTNCRQCHVAQNTQTLFVEARFEKFAEPETGTNNALLGSPPAIPHQIQMRENCLACHAGPSAPQEIRVTHPERINCRQCHVPKTDEGAEVGFFKR